MLKRVGYSLTLAAALIAGLLLAPPAANAYWYGPAQNLSSTDLGGGRTQFTWEPPNPANYKGVAPSVYWVSASAGYKSYYCDGSSYRVSGTSCTISGLPYGVSVSLSVKPWAPYIGDEAVKQFVLCCSVPAAPASVVATASNGSASVAWTPPANAGAAGNAFTYGVEIRPGGAICSTDQNTCSIGGLINGVSYTFYVSASNKSGNGPAASSQAIVPIGPPSEPLSVQPFLEKGGALVTWQGPSSTGGTQINRYVAVSEPDNFTCETTGALECRVEGLSNGNTYTFTVTAFNQAGQSQPSASSKPAKLLNVTSSPTRIKTSRSGSSVAISWKPPSSSGGSKVTRYLVTSSPQNMTCNTKKTTMCRISGLKVGESYVFSVQAANKSGLSAPARSKAVYVPVPPKAQQSIS